MAITIRDVADAAGVSTATVSRALRGLPNVDEATRSRVQQVAAELDYVISPSASRLASGRTGAIAVVTPFINRWYFATVLSGIEEAMRDSGMDLLLLTVGLPDSSPRMPLSPKLRRRVDGVLMIGLPPEDPQIEEIINLGMPTALIGTHRGGVPNVTIDDFEAGRSATQHLINLGHERIGLISGRSSTIGYSAERDRIAGYREAMNAAGLRIDPDSEALGRFTVAGGEKAMTTLLNSAQRPTAVFALSDEMAFGAIRAMRAHGVEPGRDLSIVGVDNHIHSELLDLSTVAQPVVALGHSAALLVLEQLGQPGDVPKESRQLSTQLIVRGSTAPLPT